MGKFTHRPQGLDYVSAKLGVVEWRVLDAYYCCLNCRLSYLIVFLIPQVTQSVFPCGEWGSGVEFVVYIDVLVDKHRHFVQETLVYLGDERGIDIAIAKNTKSSFMSWGISMT